MKVQPQKSSESQLEYIWIRCLRRIKISSKVLIHLRSYMKIVQLYNSSSLGGEAGTEILELSRLVLSVNFLQRTLLHSEDNTSVSLTRGGITDLILLRILLTICHKSQEPSFWEVIDPFL